jgi:hypothetical protein
VHLKSKEEICLHRVHITASERLSAAEKNIAAIVELSKGAIEATRNALVTPD